MNTTQVIPIPILPVGMINAFLVIGPGGKVLVDAGLKGSEKKFAKVLHAQGLEFSDIDAVIITHAHGDHAGSADGLKKLTNAPLIAHEADLPYYRQEKQMTYCPTGPVGRLMKRAGVGTRGYKAFTPDILLAGSDVFDLSEFGLNGAAFSTPGHTKGSISVTLSDRQVLAGDLVSSGILLGGVALKGRVKPPPFEEDRDAVVGSLTGLVDQGFETFFLGHGGPLSSRKIKAYCRKGMRDG